MYDPGADAADRYPDVRIKRVRLEGAVAAYIPSRRLMFISRALDRAGWRSCVAHELVHLDRGDTCVPEDTVAHVKQERAVDNEASRRLIDLAALADALTWALDPREVADALHVDASTVRARIRSLTAEEKDYIERRIAAKGDAA